MYLVISCPTFLGGGAYFLLNSQVCAHKQRRQFCRQTDNYLIHRTKTAVEPRETDHEDDCITQCRKAKPQSNRRGQDWIRLSDLNDMAASVGRCTYAGEVGWGI